MLFRKQSRGDKHCNLTVVGDSNERGTQCHFCFSEPDIAADQAIHWFCGLQVVQCILDRI